MNLDEAGSKPMAGATDMRLRARTQGITRAVEHFRARLETVSDHSRTDLPDEDGLLHASRERSLTRAETLRTLSAEITLITRTILSRSVERLRPWLETMRPLTAHPDRDLALSLHHDLLELRHRAS